MRSLKISSVRGGYLDLLNDPYFHLVEFSAETENSNNISASSYANFDGDVVNNVQALPRTAELELQIKSGVSVEMAKRHILQVIKPKQVCTFHLEQDGRNTVLSGYVESIAMPRYNNAVSLVCTFHCSQPFWEDAVDVFVELSNVDDAHHFTEYAGEMLYFPAEGIPLGVYNFSREKTYTNGGDVAVGVDIRITATDTVTNPKLWASDGSYIGVNVSMVARDVIIISTHKGKKGITLNGANILDKIMSGSTWLQLETGLNAFNVTSDDESIDNCYFELAYRQRYV